MNVLMSMGPATKTHVVLPWDIDLSLLEVLFPRAAKNNNQKHSLQQNQNIWH